MVSGSCTRGISSELVLCIEIMSVRTLSYSVGQRAAPVAKSQRTLRWRFRLSARIPQHSDSGVFCRSKGGPFSEIAQSTAVSLVRYCDILPADRVFFEAGQACKNGGKLNQAFVLTNRFIDISEMMDEGGDDVGSLENSDFEGTDVPFEFHIQEIQFLPEKEREETRDWVLTLSMDQKVREFVSASMHASMRVILGSSLCI